MIKSLKLAALLLTLSPSFILNSAEADIIVDVQDAFITAGGSGFVDVLISSTGTDDLEFASYLFELTNVGAPSSTLEYAAQNFTEDLLGNYVFFGDNAGILSFTDGDPLYPNSQFGATDQVDLNGAVTLTGATQLLARLELNHVLGGGQAAADTIGEQFRITMLDTGDTLFADDVDDLIIDASSFAPLGVGGGIITVQAAAVPEPSSFAVLGFATAGFCAWRRKKNRKQSAPAENC